MVGVKTKLSFILCIVAMTALFSLGWFKDVNVASAIMEVAAIYVIGRSAALASHGWATSRDPNADTRTIVEQLKEHD